MSDTPKVIQRYREIEGWRPEGEESEGEIARRQFDRDKMRRAQELTAALVDLTNTMGCDEQIIVGILAGLIGSHRYLQEKAVLAVLKALGEFGALPEGQFTDARNEFAHKVCGELRTALRDRIFWNDPVDSRP